MVRNMANVSIAEPSVILPLGTQVNEQALGQTLFTTRKYVIFRRESGYTLYGRLQESSNKKYDLCDLLIVSRTASDKVEEAVPKMDTIAEHLRRELLNGKSPSKDILVKKHPFMRLHRPLIQFSFIHNARPVGFHIRPLLLIQDRKEVWDYYMGATSRVDVVSFEGETLGYYLKEHAEVLKNVQCLDFKKYSYPKIAQKLIAYGHFPIVIMWIIAFFSAMFQIPFLGLSGMVLLTIFPYLGLLGIVYMLHQGFARTCRAELQESAPFQSTRSTPCTPSAPQSDASTENLVLGEVVESPDSEKVLEVSEEREVIAPKFRELPPIHQVSPITTIHQLINKVMAIKDPEDLSESATQLLSAVLHFVLEKNKQEIPKNTAKLPELVKLLRADNAFNLFYRSLITWATKLETQTPFEVTEMVNFKKFLLYLLYGLQLLPEQLAAIMKEGPPTKNASSNLSLSAPPAHMNPPTQSVKAPTSRDATNTGLKVSKEVPPPEKVVLPEESPDIEVDSQTFIEIPEVNRIQLQQMREKDPNGIYCVLVIDKKSPEFQEIAQEFELITKNYDDAHRVYIGADQIDPTLDRELCQTPLPAIMVGCGMSNRQILRYRGSPDDTRLNSIISNYVQRSVDINEDPDRTEGEAELAHKDYLPSAETENLISFKVKRDNSTEEENLGIRDSDGADQKASETELAQTQQEEQGPPFQGKEAKGINEKLDLLPEEEGAPQAEQVELTDEAFKTLLKEEGIPQNRQNEPPLIQEFNREEGNIPEVQEGEISRVVEEGLSSNYNQDTLRLNNESESATAKPAGVIQRFPLYGQKLVQGPNLKEIELVAVDGTNLLYLFKDHREAGPEPRLECVFRVVEMLLAMGFPKERIAVFFDANITETFKTFKRPKDAEELDAYIEGKEMPKFRKVTGGIKADTGLIALGNCSVSYIVVTNDGLKEYPSAFRHRVGITLDLNNKPRLLINSMTDLLKIGLGKG